VVKGLRRRSGTSGEGYDIFNYEAMLTRVANEYDAAFTRI